MKFKGAAESYQFHEAREKQGNRYENSYKVHAKDMDLIQSLIQLIDEVPSVPIGKVFPKVTDIANSQNINIFSAHQTGQSVIAIWSRNAEHV